MSQTRTPDVQPSDPALLRRNRLLTGIQERGGTIRSAEAARINAAGGFGPHRNTARLDLKALAARGHLVPHTVDGRRYYTLPDGETGGE